MSKEKNREWNESQLGEMLTFQRGFDITKKQQYPGEYAVISSSGANSSHNQYKVKGPGVVIGRKGTLGTVFFSQADYWPHDTTLWVKDFHGNDPKFTYYFLQTLHIEKYDCGASNPTINRNHIHTLPVRYPAISEQRKIAAMLSAYDDLIENNTRRIQILEEMAGRIYEEWFMRFRFPGYEKVRMVESELGLIPEGWEVKRLGEIVELVYGKALRANERKEGSVPVYGSSGIVGFHNSALVNEAGIIVGRKGNVGSVYLSDVSFYPIDTVYYTKTSLPLSYVFFNLKRQNFINNDAAVPGLNRNQAHSLPLLLPARRFLNEFDAIMQNLFSLSRRLQAKNDNLRTTRDLLLPKLISGEIDVSHFPDPDEVN